MYVIYATTDITAGVECGAGDAHSYIHRFRVVEMNLSDCWYLKFPILLQGETEIVIATKARFQLAYKNGVGLSIMCKKTYFPMITNLLSPR